MKKKELREGLQRLDAYVSDQGFKSLFIKEGKGAAMDSLLLGLEIEEDLSVDISCNFVYTPELGSVLQFFGQLEVDELFGENPEAFEEQNVLELVNELNQMIPLGQFLFMQDTVDGEEQNAIGIRYTMLTALDSKAEMEKCVSVIRMLMDIYELLCSSLMLMVEGETVEGALQIIIALMNE